jgi:hypothetical protein
MVSQHTRDRDFFDDWSHHVEGLLQRFSSPLRTLNDNISIPTPPLLVPRFLTQTMHLTGRVAS